MGDDRPSGPSGPYGPYGPRPEDDPSAAGDVPGYETPDPGWASPGYGPPGAPDLPSGGGLLSGGGLPSAGGFPGGPGDPGGLYGDQAGWAPPGWGQPQASPGGGPGSPGWSGSSPGFDEPPIRRRRPAVRVAALVVTLVLIGAVVLPVVILTGLGSSSQASSLYSQSMQAAANATGFHYASSWTGGGQPPLTFSGDAGPEDGSQADNEPSAFGDEQYDLILAADQTVYFEGNPAALEDQLGVPASAAPALAGDWISLSTGDGPYNQEQDGLTIASEIGIPGFVATATGQVTGADGAQLTRVTGTVPASDGIPNGSVQLDIAPGSDLPISIVVSYSDGSVETITYSQWGTAPSVAVPTGAIAWSSLTTSEPPDGYGSGETPAPSAAPAPTATPSAAAGA